MNAPDLRQRPSGAAWLGIAAAFLVVGLLLVVPVLSVFAVAFSKGVDAFLAAVSDEATLSAVRLTLLAVAFAVPANALFGLSAAWALTKFDFRGKALLAALVDLPLSVSPVVAGLLFVMLFGARGLFGPWFVAHGLQVVYAPPGIVLATVFVTFPYVARELVPLMEAIGRDEELAALALGARGWHLLRRVTLPNVRWGLFHGVVVCTARAVGEFGAVSVVSGHIRGETTTLPLHVEILQNEYDQAGAFAVASLVTTVGLVSLVAKKWFEARLARTEAGR
jgi:sulfate transport system permease protein